MNSLIGDSASRTMKRKILFSNASVSEDRALTQFLKGKIWPSILKDQEPTSVFSPLTLLKKLHAYPFSSTLSNFKRIL